MLNYESGFFWLLFMVKTVSSSFKQVIQCPNMQSSILESQTTASINSRKEDGHIGMTFVRYSGNSVTFS